MDALKWYIENRPIYKRLANKVNTVLVEILEMEKIPYHMIQFRAKEIESFNNKISGDKYKDPLNEIHDFAGIRVITYVEDEVEKVKDVIEKAFKIDWKNSLDKSESLGVDKVGYKSVHYVAHLKADRLKLPENTQFKNKCFEIQVRTILQHAWAEIEHDRNYKFSGVLPQQINRRFKILSGTLELVDREFNSIAQDIDTITSEVKNETSKGNFDIKLNSTTFSEYFKNRFPSIMQNYEVEDLTSKTVIKELNDYGITNIKDFDKIIPKDFENQFVTKYVEIDGIWAGAIVRSILIVNDYDSYFEKINPSWNKWSDQGNGEKFFEHYKVDWKKIEEKYNITFK